MDVELSQAILIIDNELKGNIHYPQWEFIIEKLKHLEIANGSVWGLLQTQMKKMKVFKIKLKN